MNDQTLRAFIGVIGTVTGVLLGWFLQRLNNSTDRRADYREFIAYSEKLIKEIIYITEEGFSSREALNISVAPPYRSVFPDSLKEGIIELQKRARSLDADLAIYLMWLNQAIENLNKHISGLHKVAGESHSCDTVSLSIYIVIQGAKKTKEICYCIWYLCLKKSSFINLIKVHFYTSYKEVRMVYKQYKNKYSYKLELNEEVISTENNTIDSPAPRRKRRKRRAAPLIDRGQQVR